MTAMKRHGHENNMMAIESRLNSAQGNKRTNEQRCANEQNQRQSNFADYDNGLRSLASHSSTLSTTGLTQDVFESLPANIECREQAKNQSSQQRNPGCENQDPPIEPERKTGFSDVRKGVRTCDQQGTRSN